MVISKTGEYNLDNSEITISSDIKATINNYVANIKKITLEKNSFLNINLINDINELTINLMENSELNLFALDITKESNASININLIGKNSKANLNIRTYADKELIKNFNIKVNHLNEATHSNIINYGIANDSSIINMNIISHIDKGFKKSTAYQNTRVISLSDTTKATLSPILEIKEFDVEGGHSATFSKITDEEIYYLQSRGFSKKDAVRLITVSTLSSGTKLELENLIEERVSHE